VLSSTYFIPVSKFTGFEDIKRLTNKLGRWLDFFAIELFTSHPDIVPKSLHKSRGRDVLFHFPRRFRDRILEPLKQLALRPRICQRR
jgi:hypothetical protein